MADVDDKEIIDIVHEGTKQEGSSGTNIPCRSTLTRYSLDEFLRLAIDRHPTCIVSTFGRLCPYIYTFPHHCQTAHDHEAVQTHGTSPTEKGATASTQNSYIVAPKKPSAS
jgi:hypothetical protein